MNGRGHGLGERAWGTIEVPVWVWVFEPSNSKPACFRSRRDYGHFTPVRLGVTGSVPRVVMSWMDARRKQKFVAFLPTLPGLLRLDPPQWRAALTSTPSDSGWTNEMKRYKKKDARRAWSFATRPLLISCSTKNVDAPSSTCSTIKAGF